MGRPVVLVGGPHAGQEARVPAELPLRVYAASVDGDGQTWLSTYERGTDLAGRPCYRFAGKRALERATMLEELREALKDQ